MMRQYLRWWHWVVVAWLAAAILVAWPIATNEGVAYPDELLLAHSLADGAPIFEWRWFTRFDQLFYRPLGYAAFSAQLAVVESRAPAMHWLSLLHHAANTGLCAWLFTRLGAPWRAALPLLAMPTMIGGVAWVACAYDRLALTWLLSASLCLTCVGARALLALPCFLVALCCKESTVMLPAAAWLLTWRRPGWPRRTAMAITVAALAFVVGRALCRDSSAEYTLQFDVSAAGRMLRYAAFPFSWDSLEVAYLYGERWWSGLLGGALLVGIACRRAPAAAAAGVLVAGASVLPVVFLPRVQDNYVYLTSVPLVWLLWLVCGSGRSARDPGSAPPLRRLPAWWLASVGIGFAVPLVLHSYRSACYYRDIGTAMRALAELHASMPAAGTPLEVVAFDKAGEVATVRYAFHVDHFDLRPRVRHVRAADAGVGAYAFDANHTLRRL